MAAAYCLMELLEEDDFEDFWTDAESVLLLGGNLNRQSQKMTFKGYAEEIVPLYSPSEFKQHFRVTTTTYEKLVHTLAAEGQLKVDYTSGGRPPVSIDKHVLLGLWAISTKEKYTSIADRFGMSESTAYTCFTRFCKAVCNCASSYIQFPVASKQTHISTEFLNMCSLPGIIGAVDGTHIPIMAPRQHQEDYVNRKGFHSINVQLITAANKEILNVFSGFPGSVHDSRVFQNSQFFTDASTLISGDNYLVGDSAYPLKPWLIVPYKNTGFLSAKQKKFNKHLSRGRVVVENTIGILKGRFRRLKYLEMYKLSEMQNVIIAACVLHNVCLLQGDPFDDQIEEEEEVNDFIAYEPDMVNGKTKRDELSSQLWSN